MKNWEESALAKIRGNFANKSFTATEAAKLFTNYSSGTIYRLLNDLTREGKMTKLGYAIYGAEEPPPRRRELIETRGKEDRRLSPNLERARKLLSDAGLHFMLTGYSVLTPFIHLLPRRIVHLVYVELGAGESSVEALERGGFVALLNPKNEREVNLTLDLTNGDLFVIRERRGELCGSSEGGVASVERGLIDLYFESTRRRIPFPEAEVGRIMLNAARRGNLDFSRFTKLASRRGIVGEIRAILTAEVGGGETALPADRGGDKATFNEHVKAVLATADSTR